jgi:LysM repeat protein
MFARFLVLAVVAAVIVVTVTRTSSGAGPARVYTVRAGDTLWSIAARSYGGDPRAGIWKIRDRNALGDAPLVPGERLVLP